MVGEIGAVGANGFSDRSTVTGGGLDEGNSNKKYLD